MARVKMPDMEQPFECDINGLRFSELTERIQRHFAIPESEMQKVTYKVPTTRRGGIKRVNIVGRSELYVQHILDVDDDIILCFRWLPGGMQNATVAKMADEASAVLEKELK